MVNVLSVLGATIGLAPNEGAVALGSYNVDPNSVSVSGLSSGGFMAAQLGVAYSNVFKVGFGVFAGGPYDCARNQSNTACMFNNVPTITTPTANMEAWSGNQIDPIANLKSRRIYFEIGTADTTVGVNPMNQLRNQLANFYNASMVSYVLTEGAAHTFPTDIDVVGNNPCGLALTPFISNCKYDGAGAVLKWMYGNDLAARNTGALKGSVVSFNQTGTYGGTAMDKTAYLYVPTNCKNGQACKLHVSLHGCQQSFAKIGMKYVDNTGYNKWADTNNIIILYPQTIPDYSPRMTWASNLLSNPNSCWDWVGWYGNNADQKGGVHMAAIVSQVNRIISGFKG